MYCFQDFPKTFPSLCKPLWTKLIWINALMYKDTKTPAQRAEFNQRILNENPFPCASLHCLSSSREALRMRTTMSTCSVAWFVASQSIHWSLGLRAQHKMLLMRCEHVPLLAFSWSVCCAQAFRMPDVIAICCLLARSTSNKTSFPAHPTHVCITCHHATASSLLSRWGCSSKRLPH